MGITVITTKDEEFCLAPEKKIKQIEKELKEKIRVISVNNNGAEEELREICKTIDFEEEKFIIETKDSNLISIINEYTTCHTGEAKCAIELDDKKDKLKEFLKRLNIATPEGFVCKKDADVSKFKYPCFIKPADFEDSIGIDENSVCRTQEEAQKALDKFMLYNKILVEEYLEGEEYTVAVIQLWKDVYMVLPARMDMPKNERGDRILGYKEKLGDDCKLVADFSQEKKRELIDLALKTFFEIGARKYARIDIRDDAKGKAKVLEVNLYAGLGEDGYMADCFRANNLSYKRMLNEVLGTTELGV